MNRKLARIGLGRLILAAPTAGIVVLFVLVPLALTVVTSFAREDIISFEITYDGNLDSYRELANGIYTDSLIRSLWLSAGATIGSIVLALPLAIVLSQAPRRVQLALFALITIPFWTSFVIRIYAWENLLLLFGLERQIGSLWILELGMVVTYLPFAVLPIAATLGRLDRSLVDAAGDLGAHGFRLFRRIILPLARPGIAAAALLVGIPATGELIVPQVLGGGKTLMLGNIMQTSFQSDGAAPLGSAIAIVLMGVLAIYAVIVRVLSGRESIAS